MGEQAAEATVGAGRGIALSNVIQDADYVRSYGIPLSKLAIEVADYSYDWQVAKALPGVPIDI